MFQISIHICCETRKNKGSLTFKKFVSNLTAFFRESGEKSSKKKCFRGCQYSSFKNPSVFPGFNYKAYTTTTGHDNQIKIQTFKWCLRQMSDGDLY